ncbi:hypothetical protein M3Y99_01525800 [Aphelenchoides fujianensis]|nr:hypothetical protein M3Y99_01525800 [Aphelenchoides fujianensis]
MELPTKQAMSFESTTPWRSISCVAVLVLCAMIQSTLFFSSCWPYLISLDSGLLFTPFGWPGVRIVGHLFASTFTAPAAFACVINVAGLVCLFVFFEERYAGLVDESRLQASGQEKARVLPRYDVVAVLIVHLVTFSQRFSFTNLETLSGPLGTSLFSWTREEITRNIAFAHGAGTSCSARLIGPLVLSNLYTAFGPRSAWYVEFLVLGATIAFFGLFFRRMVPLGLPSEISDLSVQIPPLNVEKLSVSSFTTDSRSSRSDLSDSGDSADHATVQTTRTTV